MIKTVYAFVEDAAKAEGFLASLRWTAVAHQAHTTVHILTPTPTLLPVLAPLGGVYMPEFVLQEEGEAALSHVRGLLAHADTPFEIAAFQDDVAWLAGQVRRHQPLADVVMVGTSESWTIDRLRWRVVETVVTTAGGPVVLLPPGRSFAQVEHAVLGWKESAEARRAVHDLVAVAAPGARIDVVAVTEDATPSEATRAALDQVVVYLGRLGFAATAMPIHHDNAAEALQVRTLERGADLLAVGAFAHSRFREILFGGVTHDLIRDARVPVMLSR
jgi:nucleotide-binding universal stress UspA family protein